MDDETRARISEYGARWAAERPPVSDEAKERVRRALASVPRVGDTRLATNDPTKPLTRDAGQDARRVYGRTDEDIR